MNNFSRIFATVTVVLSMIAFSSCSNDDDYKPAMPSITMEELGHENSLRAEQGGDLHVEAEVVAEGRILTINIEIHQEDGSNVVVDTTYTDFSGLKNCTFHKHVEIPETAPTGVYHFHFTVIDEEGQSATYENENLQVIANDGIDEEEQE